MASNRGGAPAPRNISWRTVCVGPVSNCGDNAYKAASLAKVQTLDKKIDDLQPYWIGSLNPEQKKQRLVEAAARGITASVVEAEFKIRPPGAKYAQQYCFGADGLAEIFKPNYARGFATPAILSGAGTYTWSHFDGKVAVKESGQYDYNPVEHMLHENPESLNMSLDLSSAGCAACQRLSHKVGA